MKENIEIHCCDNIDLMQKIPKESIDLIYCDILFGTGKKLKDYQDLKPIKEDIDAHYHPRIKEMHRILKKTGSIYLQMDNRINHWVRLICDCYFGYENFRNEIIWKYETSGRRSKNKYYKKHDTILFYGKGEDVLVEDTYLEIIDNNYNGYLQDEKGWFQTTGTGDYTDSSIEKLKKDGKIYTNNKGKNYLKIYLVEKNGKLYKEKQMGDVWDDIKTFGTVEKEIKMQKTGYITQKPKELAERIIKASSLKGDIVADFYMGSGTVAEVCDELDRRFIGCDINPAAIDIAKKRVKSFNG